MSIGVTWLVEGHLLLAKSWGKVNLNELDALDARIGEMMDNAQAPLVHGVHDLSQAEEIPSPKDLMKVESGSHPRVGWLIIVGLDDTLMKFFVSATGQVLGLRLRFMKTKEEAFAFLQDVDSTLPDIKSLDIPAAEDRIRANGITLKKYSEAS